MNEQRLSKKDQHIYVIEFASGRVKVGRTRNVKLRKSQIASMAAAFDESIAQTWSSDVHSQAIDNEEAMIDFCCRRGRQSAREYFTEVKFDAVVAFAKSLPAYINKSLLEDEILREESVALHSAPTEVVCLPFLGDFFGGIVSDERRRWTAALETAQVCQDLISCEGGYGYIFDEREAFGGLSMFCVAVAISLNDKTDDEHDAFVDRVSAALDMPIERMSEAITELYDIADAETKRQCAELKAAEQSAAV